ncbi:ficolin-2-like [Branchiostoma floridae]|uniref:Ficolin-2-like n=1 Tax=Branchiostoma floridae TaxID=7739 RepID=A0A9J7LIZ7_BRAFL|nr:ficolin-2-like [Branchiostoma floridae]
MFKTDRLGSFAVTMRALFVFESALFLLSFAPVSSDLQEKPPDPFLSPPRVSQMYYDEINRICNSETCSESCGDLSFAQLCYYVTKQGKLERDFRNKTEELQRQVTENHKNLASELANSTEFLSARVHRLSRDRRRDIKNSNKERRKVDRRVATLEELVGKHQETVTRQADLINNLLKRLDSAERLLYDLNEKISTMEAKDCMELRQKNYTRSGIYTITPAFTGVGDGGKGFDVFCDMDTDGGGWTVIQRRMNGLVDFQRGWEAYRQGFGDLEGEFWLGNDKIHQIASQGRYTLHIDMEDFEDEKRYARYGLFRIKGQDDNFRLEVQDYEGDAGDALEAGQHNEMTFSTKDKDTDAWRQGSCASLFAGAWWYYNCHCANLNGQYLRGQHKTHGDGINWCTWHGYTYSLKGSVMRIRPA